MDVSDFMKHIYPKFYEKFNCIAGKCPDSCCKDWDVVIDEETDKFYSSVNSEFGEKIKNLTTTDNDGDRIFVSQNGKCPFWNKDMLCDIYINLGEEHLCATCRNFPRITQDYTAFAEHTLSFACPEAARLMLLEENAYERFSCLDFDFSDTDYSPEFMRFLLKARAKTSEILKDRTKTFARKLKICLAFNDEVQKLIDNENFSYSDIEDFHNFTDNSYNFDCSFIFKLHKELEIMNNEWKNLLCNVANKCNELSISSAYDDEFERLALYYIYRYYLNAIDSYDVLSTIKRIVCAYVVIGKTENFLAQNNLQSDLVTLMQQYSKEVEHSYENTDKLEFEFATSSEFSVKNLYKL